MTTTDVPVRRYRMIRVRAGDYLLPSNDGTVLWRVYRYTEDGSAYLADDTPVVGEYWATAKYLRPIDRFDPDSLEDWEDWSHWDSFLPTRAAAIDRVMRAGAVKEP